MPDFIMPSLGSDMEEGVLVEWLIQPGDTVTRGQIVAVVETQKGAMEIEIFEDGQIEALLVQAGQEVPVGTVLARVLGANAAEAKAEKIAQTIPAEPEVPAQKKVEPPPSTMAISSAVDLPHEVQELALHFAEEMMALMGHQPEVRVPQESTKVSSKPVAPVETEAHHVPQEPTLRVRVSPAARRRARELNVSYQGLKQGTGPRGAISIRDIEALAANSSQPVVTQPSKTASESGMREAIAAAMSRAKREIPHYYLGHRLDLTPALEWMREGNQSRPIEQRWVSAVLLIKAVALALRKYPEMNGFYKQGQFMPSEGIHIGMAIALRTGGLVAPALFDADKKDLDTLMAEFLDLVNRARSNQLRASEMNGASITITSLGEQGVESVYPIINPPQVAMVGFGKVMEQPWVVKGEIVPREIITVSLSGDHRVSDGRRGALFLNRIEKLLRKPAKL